MSMRVRITVDFYVVPPDLKNPETDPSTQPVAPSSNDKLKAAFNTELEEVGGFQNWQQSVIADRMLDDPASVFESLDGEKRYLLEGYYEDDFFHVLIDWEHGKQPYVHWVARDQLRRRVK